MPDIASSTDPVATTLAIVALLIALVVLGLLVLVLVGIQGEERHMSLTSAPRTRIGAVTRRLTGVGGLPWRVSNRRTTPRAVMGCA